MGSVSNNSRAVVAGGGNAPDNTQTNTMEYFTIASTGNYTDFGDMVLTRKEMKQGASSGHGGLQG